MLSLSSKNELIAFGGIGLAAGGFAVCLTAAMLAAGAAWAEPDNAIPQFASPDFGWQTNVADWQPPPPGSGHGPIKPDPEHPFMSNAEAARAGQATDQPHRRHQGPYAQALGGEGDAGYE